MNLLQRYRQTLKPLAVEEPIDVVWHRLLGYAVARASFPTPISADAITIAAIFIGFASGACLAVPFAHHLAWGAALCTLSAVFDCADGQLARMRKRSSNFGRMLDGASDTVVMAVIGAGAMVHLARGHLPPWQWLFVVLAGVSCTFHFAYYDHYKNVYLRLTEATYREGEDVETALSRKEAEVHSTKQSLVIRGVWALYIWYMRSQANVIHGADPYTSSRLNLFPAWEPARAEIYRKHCLGPMRVWRSLFGLGTHVFTLSLAIAFDRIDVYVVFRLFVLNTVGYAWLMPWQRRASKAAFEEMALRLPDQRGFGPRNVSAAI
jgi:hypothetical protein